MKEAEKAKLVALDPTGCNGTIASVLLNPNINEAPYPDVLYYLLVTTLREREYLEKMYQKFFNVIQGEGMMTNELLEI